MARAYGEVFVADTHGNVVAAAAVDLLDPLTDLRISATVYADATSSTEITLPTVTDATGKLPFYLAVGQIVKARATINGVTFDDIIAAGDPTAIGDGSGGSGATLQTQTVTVTTDADTFIVSHTFDLGHVTVAYAKLTVLAITPDGETFGGEIGNLVVDTRRVDQSADGVDWVNIPTSAWFHDQDPVVVAAEQVSFDLVTVVGRYLRYNDVRIAVWDSIDTYAGANHPTAQVQIDIEYLSATASDGGGDGGDSGSTTGTLDITVSNGSAANADPGLIDLPIGTVVNFSYGVNANGVPLVFPSRDGDTPGFGTPFGIMLTDLSTAANATGTCRLMGPVTGVDTHLFAPGDSVYAGALGAFTTTSNSLIGICQVQDVTAGVVFVINFGGLGYVAVHGHEAAFDGSLLTFLDLPEIASASLPAVGRQELYIDSVDHKLKRVDHTGTIVVIG